MGYILSISMCMQNFITIFHSVQETAPLSLFQNLELGKASTYEKCHFAISCARSCQYQCLRNSLSTYSTQFKRSFLLFQNLALGKDSTDDKCHFAIPWARSCQYQFVCKILSKYMNFPPSQFFPWGKTGPAHSFPGEKTYFSPPSPLIFFYNM